MTHDDEVFIEIANRIRERHMEFENITLAESFMPRMANRIEELSAENERLREALGWFLNDSRFVVQVGGNPNVVPQMIEAARAALGETK